jgi:hypothetical protein
MRLPSLTLLTLLALVSSAPAVAGTQTMFAVSFSYPKAAQTVRGTQTVGMATTAPWRTPKTLTLSVDGAVVLTRSVATGSTVWTTWDTTRVANGTRTLQVAVSANGQTVTAERSVTVANATRSPNLISGTTAPAAYYVSAGGDDANSGRSPSEAWRSLEPVNRTAFGPGDRILLEGGHTFHGSIRFDQSDRGTPSAPITLTSYGGGRATVNAGAGMGVHAYNTSGIVIANLDIVGAGIGRNSESGIDLYTDLDGNPRLPFIRIDQVEVSGFGDWGIAIGGWNAKPDMGSVGFRDVRITNAEIHGNQRGGIIIYARDHNVNEDVYVGHVRASHHPGDPTLTVNSGNGIVLGSVQRGTVEHSVAHDNGWLCTAAEGPVGIWTYNSTEVTIQFNEAYRNRTSGPVDGGGFDLDINVSNSVMQYNYSYDNDGAGFLLYQVADNGRHTGNVVRYNISVDDGRRNGFGGIHIGGKVRDALIYHNTVVTGPSASGVPAAIRIDAGSTGITVLNNIFQTSDGVPQARIQGGGVTMQGNNYYSAERAVRIIWNGLTYTSLPAWRTATGQERLDGADVGQAVDPALDGLRLQGGSTLVDAGLELPALFGIDPGHHDHFGTPLPAGRGYDVGAHEHAGTR